MPATGPRADRGRANAGETAECIDLSQLPALLRATWPLLAIADAESSPLRRTHVASGQVPPPPPLPAQTTRKLAMGVAATSQVLLALGNIICDILSGKIFNLALQCLFGGSKLYFYVTRCRHHLFFSYTTSCRCWHACASFWAIRPGSPGLFRLSDFLDNGLPGSPDLFQVLSTTGHVVRTN
jgi:hypothetical protein